MKITIETTNPHKLQRLLELLKELKIDDFSVIDSTEKGSQPTILQRDQNIDPTELFGIWKNKPRSLEEIRKRGWKRGQA
ncbi:MAG: hypothetical protein H6581_13500 [Bacteroidia bacterium]|nr:hypothetical protein [Bacteroidia bacterium]